LEAKKNTLKIPVLSRTNKNIINPRIKSREYNLLFISTAAGVLVI
jgi:hypothetical protein